MEEYIDSKFNSLKGFNFFFMFRNKVGGGFYAFVFMHLKLDTYETC